MSKKNQDARVRRAAVKALKELGNKASAAVPALAQALKEDPDVTVRTESLAVLTSIRPVTHEAIDAFARALTADSDKTIRLYSAMALRDNSAMARSSPPAVEALESSLNDPDDPFIRRVAAKGLFNLNVTGKVRNAALKMLTDNLTSLDQATVVDSAWILATAGAHDMVTAAIPRLRIILKDHASSVWHRQTVAETFGYVASMVLFEDLAVALKEDPELEVRRSAAQALGSFGAPSLPLLRALGTGLDDPDINVRLRAVGQSYTLLSGLSTRARDLSIEELSEGLIHAAKVLKAYGVENAQVQKEMADVTDKFNLELERKQAKLKNQKDSVLKQTWKWASASTFNAVFSFIVAYVALGLLFWSLVYLVRPLWLLRLSDALRPFGLFTFPDGILAGLSVDLRLLLLVRFFEYRPRVLDAWVAAHIQAARESFENDTTVTDRKVHIDLPVMVDGHVASAFSGEKLRRAFIKQRACVLIVGEGGSGKTSLACHIARLAMADQEELRPSKHLMLPVLIEQELDMDIEGEQPFMQAIRGQLQALTGVADQITRESLRHLLRSRRILIIVDHFSEMSEATRKHVRPGDPGFLVNALVVTSRLVESLDNVPKTVVKPLRIEGNRLSSFMEAYLTECGKRDLFDDPEYFDLCRRLSLVVGERNVTVLLAKLYVEQVIALKRRKVAGQLPENVPDLMLSYLNQLNRDVTEEKADERTIHRDAKIIAWECLRQNYRPQPAYYEAVIAALGGNGAEGRLRYLEKRLRLVETLNPAQDRVRYTLDPLAEYLAGLHLIDSYRGDESAWQDFLLKAKQAMLQSSVITGFLAAVKDTCAIKGGERNVPTFVEQELAALLAAPSEAVKG